jgi:hypothetical protein
MLVVGAVITLWIATPAYAEEKVNDAETAAYQVHLPFIANSGQTGAPISPTPVTPTPLPPTPVPPTPAAGALFLDRTRQTNSASLQVGEDGAMHIAYAAFGLDGNGQNPAFYATCDPGVAACDDAAAWRIVALSNDVQEVQLRLTPADQPRLLLRTGSGAGAFQYAACDDACTLPANWSLITVAYHDVVDMSLWDYGQNYFALDRQGRPRFVYFDNQGSRHWGSFYVFCDAECTDPNNWHESRLDQGGDDNYEMFSHPSLAFTAAGQPRLVTQVYTPFGPSALYYLACDAACEDSVNWQRQPLYHRGDGYAFWALRLDSADRPRLAFYQGALEGNAGERLYYIWCNEACTDQNSWNGVDLKIEQGMGKHPDLFIDADDRPHLAFQVGRTAALGYAYCLTECESANGEWQALIAEPSSALDEDFPISPPIGCLASYWYGGYRPSLALDGAGNPRIAYDAEHLYGDGVCATDRDYKAVRVVYFVR